MLKCNYMSWSTQTLSVYSLIVFDKYIYSHLTNTLIRIQNITAIIPESSLSPLPVNLPSVHLIGNHYYGFYCHSEFCLFLNITWMDWYNIYSHSLISVVDLLQNSFRYQNLRLLKLLIYNGTVFTYKLCIPASKL